MTKAQKAKQPAEHRHSKETLQEIALQARQELARRNMAEFVLYTDAHYTMNWHHQLICDYLDRLYNKEIKRLMIFTPPRHGKSELVSRKYPAFIFGKNPNASIISTSYSADLASRMNRDVQRIMDGERYAQLFPGSHLYGKNTRSIANGTFLRNSDIFEIVDHKGVYRSAGVGGGITGMGGDYIIIDDPIKNREEANSNTYREKLWDWYTSTLYTRLEENGCILITLTRWHEDDLAGRLMKKMKEEGSDQWTVISLPAICDEKTKKPYDIRGHGEALWPSKYDVDALMTIKATIGSYDWGALYDQQPSPNTGGLFKRSWWKRWSAMPGDLFDYLQSWDCAFKDTNTSDFVVGQVWARSKANPANRYLLDQVRGRMSFTETVAAMRDLSAKWPQAVRKLVEDKANGTAVIDVLKNKLPGLVPVEPRGGKVVRAQAVTAVVEAGNVWIPDSSIAPWVNDFVEEMASFPSGASDDQVDATTQANAYYNENTAFDISSLIS